HQGGEVASALAVQILEAEATGASVDSFRQGVQSANRAIFEQAGSDGALHGMGTTLCAVRLIDTPDGELIAWANVGDSRIYLFRDGSLIQLSEDHSLVEDLVRDGQLSKDAAAIHPQRHIVTRALGIDVDVDVDLDTVIPYRGDRYLLCSDGLFNEVDDSHIAGVLRRLVDPDEASAELVRLANEHGGRDNITVVLVEVIDDGGRAESASAAMAGDPTRPVPIPPGPANDRYDEGDALDRSPSSLPDADEGDLPAGSERPGDFYGDLDRARTKHWTWRVAAFALLLLLVLGAAAGAVGWYARRTYFVGFRDGEVTILKGRPGGLLWFDPTVEQRTSIKRAQVPQGPRDDIDQGKDQSSRDAAVRYVANLQEQLIRPPQKATTTTTTRAKAATTTTAARAAKRPATTAAPAKKP
ncbi:MAG: SpoIIE family protein phosphatase, partial [Actinomycetota bacterium]|nr:SpoIIE family protein phosphatase [Actinomycetota bacterium]